MFNVFDCDVCSILIAYEVVNLCAVNNRV